MGNQKIVNSWKKNANSWIRLIEENGIESRKLATNQAVIEAVLSLQPQKVLDAGCGEGWLTRALLDHDIDATGVDAIEELVKNANSKNPGRFYVKSYQDLINHSPIDGQSFDVVIFNFALLDEEMTEAIVPALTHYLKPGGNIVIQTLHPVNAEPPYSSGWRPGSWKGIPGNFSDPYDWYFRTLGDWVKLLVSSGFNIEELIEPIHPETQKVLSLILVASVN